jgi:hypothetical protein
LKSTKFSSTQNLNPDYLTSKTGNFFAEVAIKVIFYEDFYQVYISGAVDATGCMQAIIEIIKPEVEFLKAGPAKEAEITFALSRDGS